MISSDSLQEPNGFVDGGEIFSMYPLDGILILLWTVGKS
jgi:hypothetical protein